MKKVKFFSQGELHTNCIVLHEQSDCVVIDVPFNSVDAQNYILANGLKVKAVLLTHGHFDHCGGVHQLLRRVGCENARIFVSKQDALLCRSAASNQWRVPCDACYPTDYLSEGELCVDDFRFDVLATPGHTGGSVVFLMENYMFSGDTLFNRSIGRTDFAESLPEAMPYSLARLRRLEKNYIVIPGHGFQTTLTFERENNPYLK